MKENSILKKVMFLTALVFMFFSVSECATAADTSNIQRFAYNEHLYALINNPQCTLTRDGIEAYSESLGGHLVYIRNAAQNNYVYKLIQNYGTQPYYGLGIVKVGGSWQYYDGTPITYSNWASGEPNNNGGYENYAEMYTSGVWNDIPNTSRAPQTAAVIEWDNDEEAVLRYDTASDDVKNGQYINLDVKFTNKEEINKIFTNLKYDPAKLQLQNVTCADNLKVVKKLANPANGTIVVGLKSKDNSPITGKTIMTLRFKAVSTGSTLLSFNSADVSKDLIKKPLTTYDCVSKFININ